MLVSLSKLDEIDDSLGIMHIYVVFILCFNKMGRKANLREICGIKCKLKFKAISVNLRMFIFKFIQSEVL